MNHFDFFKYDLNLLVAFDALYAERSVSVAAQKVGVSQSAMSQSLRRLRTTFGDELFIRAPRGVEPTQLAIGLSTPVRESLQLVHRLLIAKSAFAPGEAERVFTLTMSDAQQLLLLPGLLEVVGRQAPGVTLRTLPFESDRVDRQLDDGELDLAISRFEQSDARHPTVDLFEERLMCLFNPNLVKTTGGLTLDEYLRHPHVLVAHGGGMIGEIDKKLPKRKGKRRILLTTPYAHAVPFILERVAAIGIVPGRMAAHCTKAGTLAAHAPPVKVAPYLIRTKWHARATGDPGMQWLRQVLQSVAATESTAVPRRRRSSTKPRSDA